jgi:hypothetical protein
MAAVRLEQFRIGNNKRERNVRHQFILGSKGNRSLAQFFGSSRADLKAAKSAIHSTPFCARRSGGIRHVVVKSEGVGWFMAFPSFAARGRTIALATKCRSVIGVGGHLGLAGRLLLSSLVCRLLFTLVIPIAEKEAE